jgi:alpha-beta hydrolase superfamily lysophospholipase
VWAWVTDPLLGKDGYEAETVKQPDDYAGEVVSTVVRRLPEGPRPKQGVLYVHGYNDYFFQSEMGREFNDSGYAFYAVDLRKYGRSLLPGQRRYEARDMNEYFADIDSAITRMRRDSIEEIVLMGHSTGGLITSLYMEDAPAPEIKVLILNSPFLDWNFTGMMRNVLIPMAAATGKLFPNISIPQGDDTTYGESLLKGKHGEWEYDTTLKLLHPAPVTTGWVRAIDQGHKRLMENGRAINVPIYLMHSRRSVSADDQSTDANRSAEDQSKVSADGWNPEASRGDAVLNIDSIAARGRRLGPHVTEAIVTDGLHDLLLSRPAVRRATYDAIFRFLRRTLPQQPLQHPQQPAQSQSSPTTPTK